MDFKKLLQNRSVQLITIVLVTLIAYINILQNGFAWDDRDFFLEWPQIKDEEGLPAYLSLPYLLAGDLPLNHRGIYRPLRSVYYLASYNIWGENPLGYHIQTITVHILIALLVYLITEIITKKRVLAFIVALLFATHPIHTESVTYIAASMDTLGILFFFLSFYFYLKMKDEKRKKGIYLLGSIIYAFFAFFTYEMTLVLPILIVFYDFSTNNFSFRKITSKINTYKNYFLVLIVYFLIRFVVLGIGNRADYLGPGWAIAANQARVGVPEIFTNYLSWLVWPVNLTINHVLPINLLLGYVNLLGKIDPSGTLTASSTRIVFLLPILYVLTGIILIYLLLKKYPLVFFGSSWLIISLLPVLSIIPQGATMAERYLYIPSFGFTLLLGFLFYYGFASLNKSRAYKPFAYILISLLPLVIAFYSCQTIRRNQDWRNEKTIWQSAIKVDPQNPLPHKALAAVYVRENQYDEAIGLYIKTLELNQPDPTINLDLGKAYEKKGEIEKAKIQYQKALEIYPRYYIAHVYLGHIYLKENYFDLAEKEYKSALKDNQNNPIILSYLGNVYFQQKKYVQALEFYKQASNFDPNSDMLSLKIGQTYLKQSNYDLAIEAFNKSLELNPRQPQAYLGLADVYKLGGDNTKATETLKKGLLIIRNNTTLLDGLESLEGKIK